MPKGEFLDRGEGGRAEGEEIGEKGRKGEVGGTQKLGRETRRKGKMD